MKLIIKSLYQNSRNKYIKELILDSFNKDCNIRFSVAQNSITSTSILEYLSKDENDWVREAVARNSKTPIPVLEFLSKDENKYICETAHNTFKKIRK